MTNEKEKHKLNNAKDTLEKAIWAEQAKAQGLASGGLLSGQAGCANPRYEQQACRTSLRERIASQRYRSEAESRNAALLAELEELLDRNPEFARILDLIELVRG